MKTNTLFDNPIILEYLSEDVHDKDYYLNLALINTELEFSLYETQNIRKNYSENIIKNENSKNFTSTEIYNIQKLVTLLEYFYDEKEKYLAMSNHKKFEWFNKHYLIIFQLLNYNLAGNFEISEKFLFRKVIYETRNSTLGRLYANNVSLQFFPKEARSFLCSKDYQDYDLKNSHFSILADFASLNKLDVPAIFEYVLNRDEILKKKALTDSISLALAKKKLIIAINATENYGKQQGFFSSYLIEDILKLRKHLWNLITTSKNLTKEANKKFGHLTNISLNQMEIKLQNLYCQNLETTHVLDLYKFLANKLYLEWEKKNIYSENRHFQEHLIKEKPELFSFIPFFDGAYIKTTNDALNLSLNSFVKEYNDNKIKQNSFIYFKQKSIELKEYEFIDITLLNKYYIIRKILLKCDSKKLNILLKKLNIKAFDLTFLGNITDETQIIFKETVLKYKQSVYNKLLEYSLSELQNLESDHFFTNIK